MEIGILLFNNNSDFTIIFASDPGINPSSEKRKLHLKE